MHYFDGQTIDDAIGYLLVGWRKLKREEDGVLQSILIAMLFI